MALCQAIDLNHLRGLGPISIPGKQELEGLEAEPRPAISGTLTFAESLIRVERFKLRQPSLQNRRWRGGVAEMSSQAFAEFLQDCSVVRRFDLDSIRTHWPTSWLSGAHVLDQKFP